jgi:hypothetical protein
LDEEVFVFFLIRKTKSGFKMRKANKTKVVKYSAASDTSKGLCNLANI